MNAGEPLNELEAEQMMKEADKDGDGTIDYEGNIIIYFSVLDSVLVVFILIVCSIPFFLHQNRMQPNV